MKPEVFQKACALKTQIDRLTFQIDNMMSPFETMRQDGIITQEQEKRWLKELVGDRHDRLEELRRQFHAL